MLSFPRLGGRNKRTIFGASTAAAILLSLAVPTASSASVGTQETTSATAAVSAQATLPEGSIFHILNYANKKCLFMWDGVKAAECKFGNPSEVWIQGAGNSIRNFGYEHSGPRFPNHQCLLAGPTGTRVQVVQCSGDNWQKWTRYSEGYVKNWQTKDCLTLVGDSDRPITAPCQHGNQHQMWAFK
ncbi:ricin-type beta-trefoil lectin domain protein [Streptomyces sp. NPDC002870]|uniref:ricin-type beta-trefoil lectin domain protein n=1 Tax=Streptomyces sp. NPDC002870 TaxID=3364666 RepID=UPI0036A8C846